MKNILSIDSAQKLKSYRNALASLIERLKEDRQVLAAVLVGSLSEETIISKENIYMWIIEADGVSLRRKSDGEEHRIWRTMVEHDVNIWAELIPRSRFKRMVEGASRTAFSYNFFARRQLVYSADESIEKWFEDANTLARRDQHYDRLATAVWFIHALRSTRKILDAEQDVERAWQAMLETAYSLAAVHIVESGEICETPIIYKALVLNRPLFETVYTALLTKGPDEATIRVALDACLEWLDQNGQEAMEPVLKYVRDQGRVVPLSELADHFAYSQLYPWHLESACEWMARAGLLEKLAADMTLTKKSRSHLEEPAYLYHGI